MKKSIIYFFSCLLIVSCSSDNEISNFNETITADLIASTCSLSIPNPFNEPMAVYGSYPNSNNDGQCSILSQNMELPCFVGNLKANIDQEYSFRNSLNMPRLTLRPIVTDDYWSLSEITLEELGLDGDTDLFLGITEQDANTVIQSIICELDTHYINLQALPQLSTYYPIIDQISLTHSFSGTRAENSLITFQTRTGVYR